ncbi:phage-like element PBSX protein xkdU [Desulfocucumis palustris]|uniref:Phage-like element PBSX protein xkdU n=2 Tax=Desulfocucumis palustris TaxID=1898651 RepID=A0A2L2XEL7_9FIRM|nr:phage-like element PBSX protein xkdU [Desulfocucumis palustris]
MLAMIPRYYSVEETRSLLDVLGIQFDQLKTLTFDLIDQIFAKAANWGIEQWEKDLGIVPTAGDTIELRRARVLAKLFGFPTMTLEKIEQVINQFVVNQTAKISVIPGEYAFEAKIPIDDIVWHSQMIKTVEEVKPAHLEFIPLLTILTLILISLDATITGHIVSANNFYGGEVKPLLLDGTWLLDGSQLLDGIRAESGSVVNSLQGHLQTQQWFNEVKEDIPLLLDGSWLLDGSHMLDGVKETIYHHPAKHNLTITEVP